MYGYDIEKLMTDDVSIELHRVLRDMQSDIGEASKALTDATLESDSIDEDMDELLVEVGEDARHYVESISATANIVDSLICQARAYIQRVDAALDEMLRYSDDE